METGLDEQQILLNRRASFYRQLSRGHEIVDLDFLHLRHYCAKVSALEPRFGPPTWAPKYRCMHAGSMACGDYDFDLVIFASTDAWMWLFFVLLFVCYNSGINVGATTS